MHAAESPALRATLARMDRFRRGLAQAFPWPHAQAAAVPVSGMTALQGLRDNGQMLKIFDPYKIAVVPVPHQ